MSYSIFYLHLPPSSPAIEGLRYMRGRQESLKDVSKGATVSVNLIF